MQTEWTFPSSSGSAVYTTKRHSDGALSCDCPGWRFKRGDEPRKCKHTQRVAGEIKTAAASLNVVPLNKKLPQPVAPASVVVALPSVVPSPMLASAMTEPVTGAEFDRVYAGWLMEEKHDGHRVQIVVQSSKQVIAWSRPRAGETAKARELPDTIRAVIAHCSPGIYDGELVVPGGNSWDVTAIGSRLMFIAFDLLELDGESTMGMTYEHRRYMLLEQLRKLPAQQQSVTTVESVPASWARVEAIWKRGGEGAILKRPASHYRPGHRSADWVKVKEQRAATLTITGFEAGKCGPYSKLMLRDDAGIDTTVKTLGNAMLAAITRNPNSYIGRRVVISYQLKTPSGKYRHGTFDHFAGEGE